MSNYVKCVIIGRCESWGKVWKRHWFSKDTGDCYRCGMSREDAKKQ